MYSNCSGRKKVNGQQSRGRPQSATKGIVFSPRRAGGWLQRFAAAGAWAWRLRRHPTTSLLPQPLYYKPPALRPLRLPSPPPPLASRARFFPHCRPAHTNTVHQTRRPPPPPIPVSVPAPARARRIRPSGLPRLRRFRCRRSICPFRN